MSLLYESVREGRQLVLDEALPGPILDPTRLLMRGTTRNAPRPRGAASLGYRLSHWLVPTVTPAVPKDGDDA